MVATGKTVYVVWTDMIDPKERQYSVEHERHRENCTLIGRADGFITFKDEEDNVFTITEEQLIKME